jgi:hypothetical protein
MTYEFDRDLGKGCVQCDECPDVIVTEGDDFKSTLDEAKAKGWRAFIGPDKTGGHASPGCTAEFAKGARR